MTPDMTSEPGSGDEPLNGAVAGGDSAVAAAQIDRVCMSWKWNGRKGGGEEEGGRTGE